MPRQMALVVKATFAHNLRQTQIAALKQMPDHPHSHLAQVTTGGDTEVLRKLTLQLAYRQVNMFCHVLDFDVLCVVVDNERYDSNQPTVACGVISGIFIWGVSPQQSRQPSLLDPKEGSCCTSTNVERHFSQVPSKPDQIMILPS